MFSLDFSQSMALELWASTHQNGSFQIWVRSLRGNCFTFIRRIPDFDCVLDFNNNNYKLRETDQEIGHAVATACPLS